MARLAYRVGEDVRFTSQSSAVVLLIIPAILVAGAFTLYMSTANPLFRFSDAPELAAASFMLGVAHPTGYPLYVLCQKGWSFLLPIGNPCFRASLFSAVCASVAVALVYFIALEISGPLAGVVAAAMLAFSRPFWLQATQSTVYTLNLMLGLLLLLLAVRMLGRVNEAGAARGSTQSGFTPHWTLRTAALFFFILGLGMANHLTIALAPLALFLSHPIAFARLLSKRGVVWLAILFLLAGLVVYYYMPVRAATKPALNWGDTSISARLWDHVSQRDYKFKQATRSVGQHIAVIGSFFRSIGSELGVAGSLLAIVGLISSLFKRRGFAALLIVLSLGTLLVALLYGQGAYLEQAYCLPAYMAAAILAGLGAHCVVTLIAWGVGKFGVSSGRKMAAVSSAVVIALPLLLVASNYHECNNSEVRYAYWHGENLLNTMPRDSVFFGETDTALFPLYYLKFVEGRRPDVELHDRSWRVLDYFEQNDAQSNYNREMRIIEKATAPVFYAEYPTVPAINIKLCGILLEAFLYEPKTTSIDFMRLYSNFLLEPPKGLYIDQWTQETRAKYFLLWGHQAQLQGDHARSESLFRKARTLGYDNPGLLNNLSIYYRAAGMMQDAIEVMVRATELEPESSRLLTRLGSLYFSAQRLDEAADVLRRSLKIDGDNTETIMYLANTFLVKGDLAQAERYFNRILEIMPHHMEAHNNLGFINKSQGKYDEAIEHFEIAVQIDPTSHLPYFNLAAIYSLKGDVENALKWLRRGRRYMSASFVDSVRQHADFDNVRDDPRFEQILTSEYQSPQR